MTALTVPDVLRRAEQVLAERGHCKGDYEDEQGHVCARGAINLVVTGLPHEEGEYNPLATSAAMALARYLDGYWAADVSDWNDQDTTTEAEVRAALLAAAQRAEVGQADRPYRCDGCGKTSRIARHEPGCPVVAAFDREAGTA